MPDDLYRLVYWSRNDIVGDDAVVRREIDQILKTSRHNNARVGVTGALMFNYGCFAQVLEGPHDALQGVFERIQCDVRHSGVVVLFFEVIQTRGFAEWSMAYVGGDRHAQAEFEDVRMASGFTTERMHGERVYELLHEHLLAAEPTRTV